jgi:hypothetical protein
VGDKSQEAGNRGDRDRERSDEAHWRVAEEGAEDEAKQRTEKGLEIPVPKRKDVFKVFERAAKPLRGRPPKQ